MEREEKERKNLQKMISEGNVSKNKHDEKQEEEEDGPPKVLRITRTFRLVEFDFFMESSIGINFVKQNSCIIVFAAMISKQNSMKK